MEKIYLGRLRKMLEQVDPSGKSEGLKESLENRTAAAGGPALDVRQARSEELETELTLESLDVLRRGREIDSKQRFFLEAIVMPYHRPVVDVIDDGINSSQLTGKWQKLGSETFRPWIRERVRSVGRIDIPRHPSRRYAGTGFIVGNDLLMTNRHVALIFAQGVGTRCLKFHDGQTAAIDFYHEHERSTTESLRVEKVVMIHPWWDMALLKVRGLPPERKPLTLSVSDPDSLMGREVVVVGYPGRESEGDAEFERIENRIFRGIYDVKRFQPGLLKGREQLAGTKGIVEAITHDCSTLGGNSGSAVIDVRSGNVVGLHFSGTYLVANHAVSPSDLARDSRVVDAGVRFEGRLEPRGDFYGPIWSKADATEAPVGRGDGQSDHPMQPTLVRQLTPSCTLPLQTEMVAAFANWTIPIRISVTLGSPALVAPAMPAPPSGLAAAGAGTPPREHPSTH